MGLINCPDCGIEHSDSSPACPKCGRPKQRFTKLFEKKRKVIGKCKVGLKDWRVKTAVATTFLSFVVLLPRLAKYSLRVWDPFSIATSDTSVVWYHNGGITYDEDNCGWVLRPITTSTPLGVIFTCREYGINQVQMQCPKLNDTLSDPKHSPVHIIVNAVPQTKNVDRGTCIGTLYTLKKIEHKSGWERLRNIYCASPLVKKEDVKYRDYLRLGNYHWFPPGNNCPLPRPTVYRDY